MRLLIAALVFAFTTTCAMAAPQSVRFKTDRALLKISHSGLLKAGDNLDLSISGLGEHDVFYVQRCLRQCAKVETVAAFQGKQAADQRVSVAIEKTGQYFVWIQHDEGRWDSYLVCLSNFEPHGQHFTAKFASGGHVTGAIRQNS
jgi:hypothetical protein